MNKCTKIYRGNSKTALAVMNDVLLPNIANGVSFQMVTQDSAIFNEIKVKWFGYTITQSSITLEIVVE